MGDTDAKGDTAGEREGREAVMETDKTCAEREGDPGDNRHP